MRLDEQVILTIFLGARFCTSGGERLARSLRVRLRGVLKVNPILPVWCMRRLLSREEVRRGDELTTRP